MSNDNNEELDFSENENFDSGLVELDDDIIKDIQAYMDMDDKEHDSGQGQENGRQKVFMTSEITYYDSDKDYGMSNNANKLNIKKIKNSDVDEDSEEDYTEEETDEQYDESYDDQDDEPYVQPKKKLSKEQVVNRVMAGMGIAIAAFTIFFGVVAYGIFHKDNKEENVENETVEQVIEETTTEYVDESFFVSPYSDKNISEEIKKKLDSAKLKPTKTKLNKLDNKVDKVMTQVVDSSKSNYENIRNIYDYLLVNFEYEDVSYVDEDTVYELCATVDYESFLDMKVIYRANKSLSNNEGSPDDYACAFTVLARRYGLDAYYIDGAIYNEDGEYQSHGYAVIVIDGENYIFDPSYDALLLLKENDEPESELTADSLNYQYTTSSSKKDSLDEEEKDSKKSTDGKDNKAKDDKEQSSDDDKQSSDDDKQNSKDTKKDGKDKDIDEDSSSEEIDENTETLVAPLYMSFGKTFDDIKEIYTTDDVENSMNKFSGFGTLGTFAFDASFSTTSGGNAYGSVTYQKGYSEDGNSVNASGDISISTGDKVYLSGSVSGSTTNTWKLVAKVYDNDMNYVTEATIYSATTYTAYNDVSYTPSRAGNIRLVYMVTDAYGRTCAISKTIKVSGGYYYYDDDDDDDDVETTKATVAETETEEDTTIEQIETEEPSSEEETTPEETESPQESSTDAGQAENPTEQDTTEPASEE